MASLPQQALAKKGLPHTRSLPGCSPVSLAVAHYSILEERLGEMEGLTVDEQITALIELLNDIRDHAPDPGSPENTRRSYQRVSGRFLSALWWNGHPSVYRSAVHQGIRQWARASSDPSMLTKEFGPWSDRRARKQ